MGHGKPFNCLWLLHPGMERSSAAYVFTYGVQGSFRSCCRFDRLQLLPEVVLFTLEDDDDLLVWHGSLFSMISLVTVYMPETGTDLEESREPRQARATGGTRLSGDKLDITKFIDEVHYSREFACPSRGWSLRYGSRSLKLHLSMH